MLVSPGPILRDDAGKRYADQMQGLPASAAKPGAGVRISPVRPEKLSRAILEGLPSADGRSWFIRDWRGCLSRVIQLFPRLGDWLVRRMT